MAILDKGELRADDGADPATSVPNLSIALTRYQEPDWLIADALASVAAQEHVHAEVLVLDQAPSDSVAKTCAALQSPHCEFRYQVIPSRCLSYARNRAVEEASADTILFLDADAIASPRWARFLHDALAADSVGLAGARILPAWHRRPLLIAASPVIQDQYSILDLGSAPRRFHRVVGAGFGLRRSRLGRDAHFDERLGRRPGSLLGGEESDLARRALEQGLRIVYEGRAVVHHQILPERISYRWILRRMYFAGLSRSLLTGTPSPSRPLTVNDYLALPFVLPSYAAGYLRGKWQSAWTHTYQHRETVQ